MVQWELGMTRLNNKNPISTSKYTDPRGSRLLNLLSIHGFQMRLMTISLQGLNKMIRDIQLMQAPRSDNSMSDIHLDCQCISFITEYYSCSQ